MRIFLTGATGFIGSRIAQRLRDRGDEVVALVRSPAKAAGLREQGCEIVEGDLSNDAAIERGVSGADAVIHNGADYRVGIPKRERPRPPRGQRGRHRARARRGDRRRGEEDRPRLDEQRVRQHRRHGRRRGLPARPVQGLPLDLRRDQVPRPPGGEEADRGRRPDPDRPARRGLRPRRPLRGRQHHRPDAHGEDEAGDVPRVHAPLRVRGRSRGRGRARARQGPDRRSPTSSPARRPRCASW